MSLDLLLRDVRLPEAAATDPTVDIAVAGGRIAEIRRGIAGEARETVHCGGRVVAGGFIETRPASSAAAPARPRATRTVRWSASPRSSTPSRWRT